MPQEPRQLSTVLLPVLVFISCLLAGTTLVAVLRLRAVQSELASAKASLAEAQGQIAEVEAFIAKAEAQQRAAANWQRQLVIDAARQASRRPPRIESDGFNLLP